MLPDQGSNLDSSDPESDVLPITPSGIEGAKLIIFYPLSSNLLKRFKTEKAAAGATAFSNSFSTPYLHFNTWVTSYLAASTLGPALTFLKYEQALALSPAPS